MKKHRTKIVVGVIAAAVLAISFFWGGFGGDKTGERSASVSGESAPFAQTPAGESAAQTAPDTESAAPEAPEDSAPVPDAVSDAAAHAYDLPQAVPENEDTPPPAAPPDESAPPGDTPSEKPPEVPVTPSAAPSAEPPDAPDGELTCTLVISCATVLDNMDKLREGKDVLIPPDGVILSKTVVFYEGESVFEVLRRETKAGKLHLEFVNAPIYGSAYIEGIGNLYEFDCGERSGWMYSVNGVFPNYGSSKYALSAGDKIEWLFTCDRGADIGGADAADSYVNE